MADLRTRPRIVVGLGMGATIAMAYLAAGCTELEAYPLTHLVLHTPASHPAAVRPVFRLGIRLVASPLVFSVARRVLTTERFQRWYVHALVEGPDIRPEDARILREDFERANVSVLRGISLDMVSTDFRAVLRAQSTPTLLIVGENDPFVDPLEVQKLGALMPNAQVVVQSGLAHGWTSDAIANQRRWLAAFLDGNQQQIGRA
jgi:pimeloyl-ACP methyl ester carboxylesterase